MTGSRRGSAALALPAWLLIVALLVVPSGAVAAEDRDDGRHVEPFIQVGGHRFRLGETRESVVARLGDPLGSVEYDRGGSVYLMETFAGGTEFGYCGCDGVVNWISTTNPRARTFVPVAVGDRREEALRQVAGLVATGDSALLAVRTRTTASSASPAPLWTGLILVFRGDRVARVSLSPLGE